VCENPSHNYGVSLAVWDHTVLPATRHKLVQVPRPCIQKRKNMYK